MTYKIKNYSRRKAFIPTLIDTRIAFLAAIGLANRQYLLLFVVLAALSGCVDRTDSGTYLSGGLSDQSAGNLAAAPAPVRGQFTGQITRADGSPITLPGVEFEININGVTAVGENTSFHPPVGPDGTFKLKLPQGLFYPPYGTITFPFEGKKYITALDPINPGKGTRESAAGITQNFAWRMTGPKPRLIGAKPNDVNNATDWFGISIPLIFEVYRNDTGQVQQPLPDGSRLIWQLRPLSNLIDGSEAKPLTVERQWNPNAYPQVQPLNDLPPANYEVAAVATLSDGSTKPLLLRDGSTSIPFRRTFNIVLQPYANSGEIVVPTISWVAE